MTAPENSDSWSAKSVLELMGAQSGDQPVSAQLFFDDDVSMDGVAARVEIGLKRAVERLNLANPSCQVGRVSKLARSVSVKAPASALAALMREPGFKDILPNDVADIYPKPVSRSAGS